MNHSNTSGARTNSPLRFFDIATEVKSAQSQTVISLRKLKKFKNLFLTFLLLQVISSIFMANY